MLSLLLATLAQGQLDFYDFLPEGEPTQFWIQSQNTKEIVNLLDTFTSLSKFFDEPKQTHPEDFTFPRSFEFNAIVGIVSRKN